MELVNGKDSHSGHSGQTPRVWAISFITSCLPWRQEDQGEEMLSSVKSHVQACCWCRAAAVPVWRSLRTSHLTSSKGWEEVLSWGVLFPLGDMGRPSGRGWASLICGRGRRALQQMYWGREGRRWERTRESEGSFHRAGAGEGEVACPILDPTGRSSLRVAQWICSMREKSPSLPAWNDMAYPERGKTQGRGR